LSGPAFIFFLLALGPVPSDGDSAAIQPPSWDAVELSNIFGRIQAANTQLKGDAQSDELAAIAGIAYRIPIMQGEARDAYVKRVLKRRRPDHPNVKSTQWLTALYRQFYEDLAARCDQMSRLARDRKERQFFEQMTQQSKNAANLLAAQLEIVIDGLEGFYAPLPVADGEDPVTFGGQVSVRGGVITIDGMDRMRFQDDRPKESAVRTTKGALKELYAAVKQYNISQSMIANYENTYRKNKGQLRVIVPAASPAIYLNEIARAGIEAEMATIHLMTISKKGALNEIPLAITRPKVKHEKKKATKRAEPDLAEASCADTLPMQKCIERIAEAHAKGSVFFRLD
jgi:hypothetical protein